MHLLRRSKRSRGRSRSESKKFDSNAKELQLGKCPHLAREDGKLTTEQLLLIDQDRRGRKRGKERKHPGCLVIGPKPVHRKQHVDKGPLQVKAMLGYLTFKCSNAGRLCEERQC